jgi:NitT/TauT family transport system substrate-binding protein
MRLWALGLAVCILTACGGSQATPTASSAAPASKPASSVAQMDKMTLAYTTVATEQLAASVAKEQGFFAQNGIDMDVVPIGTGSSPASALISGQIQVYQAGPEVVLANLGGADLVYVASPVTVSLFWLFTLPDITTAAQLKGKKIAVTALGSATHTGVKMALRSIGLDPDKDVFIIAVNNPPAIMAAMQNGAVQGASIGGGNYVLAKQQGWYQMVDVAKLGIPFPQGWPVMSKKFVESHQDLTQRFMKGFVEGIAFEIQHSEETQKILGKYAKSDDTAYLKGQYELGGPYLRKAPAPEVAGVKNAIAEVAGDKPEAKSIDPAAYVDARWVQSLDQSGFIAGLYK